MDFQWQKNKISIAQLLYCALEWGIFVKIKEVEVRNFKSVDQLKISEIKVKVTLHRLRKLAKKKLKERGYDYGKS